MRLESWLYYISETASSVRKNVWMAIASASVVAVTLLIFGMFLLMVINLNYMTHYIESDIEISVFLAKTSTEEDAHMLENKIKLMPGVAGVRFVSKQEGLARLQKEMQWDETDLEVLGDNPLPDAFYIKAERPEYVDDLAKLVAKQKNVDDVRYGKEVVDKLFSLTKAMRYGGILLIVLLAISAVFIISNTIKLTVFSRRKEIAIMKSVGATNWFIRWPFALEGLLMGMTGGVFATVILLVSYHLLVAKINETLPFLRLVQDPAILSNNYWIIVLMGAVIGLLGSAVSMRRFLKI